MKKDWKFYGSIAVFIVYLFFMGYMTYHNYKHPNPRVIEFVKTPVSWIDVGTGFIMGVVLMIVAMLFPLVWPYRQSGGNGPSGDGSDPKRRINLPIFGKVVSIEDLKKMPPKGPVQLVPTGS